MSAQQPSVGRIVHYVSYGTPGGEYTSQCRAAIVTEVGEVPAELEHPTTPTLPPVGLAVLNPEGFFFNRNVPMAYDHKGGTWHWPERV